MQARSEPFSFLERNALFQNELNGQQRPARLQLCYNGVNNLVNITLTLKISNLQRILNHSQIFYMDPTARVCQFLGVYPFQDDLFVEIDPKSKSKLHFKFRVMGGPTKPKIKAPEVKEGSHLGSRKSSERTVGENQIYRNLAQGGQNCTLQQAADIIGIPKKTLDDYDRNMRMAEALGFDFEKNSHLGMGYLRTFVKQHSKEPSIPKEEFIEPDYFFAPTRQ